MKRAILLIAHGSPVAAANAELLQMVDLVRAKGGYEIVEPAYLEGASPDILTGAATCVEQGADCVIAVPFFLLPGGHVVDDIPAILGDAQLRYPHVDFRMAAHLGAHEALTEVVLERLQRYNSN